MQQSRALEGKASGGFALISGVKDGADCNQWLTQADNAGA